MLADALDPATGQPWARYDGACVVSIENDVATVSAVVAVPDGAWPALRAQLRAMGVRRVRGERWEGHTKRKVSFAI